MDFRRYFFDNTYVFLTFVTANRRHILVDNIDLLKTAFYKSIANYNYEIFAICVLPDHVHMIIKPCNIHDYPYIIKQIKTYFTKNFDISTLEGYSVRESKQRKQEQDIWQRRYWEHTIRSERDLAMHTDYIHYNPIKHGYVLRAIDWQYSSFKKFMLNGFYSADWCDFSDENNIKDKDFE